MKKRLINFFSNPFNICNIIGFTLGPILMLFYGNLLGAFTPPNESDYRELHVLEEKIKNNFENVYNIDNAVIYVNKDDITVDLISKENGKYKISVKFDKSCNYIESNEVSTKRGFTTGEKHPKLELISIYIVFIISGGIILGAFITFTLYWIYKFIWPISKYKRTE